ncbi:MAG: glycosyltransferase [Nostoc sp. ChiSLP02]|nr:glycosyltransferase [Nostoc sp. DedSLP05]MDZ8100816.1 glycosyltransferase [Nostoc sp. DedSLP01]MDZ8188195.1 glycosyltransferase [Nostoc sp. ChiSLP02]
MRVLHIIPSVSHVRGGPSLVVMDIVKALRAKNIDAEIATTNDNGNYLLDVPLQKLIEYKQVPITFFYRFSPPIKIIREYAFSWQLTVWLWDNICDYDILHIHAIFSYTSTIAMAIARLKNVPYITMPHGLLCQWSLQQSSRRKQIYMRLIEQANLDRSQAIHLTSQQEHEEVAQLRLKAPIFVLPHGLSTPQPIFNARYLLRQHLKVPPDEPIILFLSRLHPKKGLDYLIPALGKLTHHRFTFAIAGSGSQEYETEIESALVANNIRDRTHFTGFVVGETKDLLLQGSDLFALTSHTENFGLAVLEALAVGVPVLLTPGVALASVVQEHQLGYVVQMDVVAIALAIEKYLTHPQEGKNMGDRARQTIREKYTWEKIVTKIIDVYQAFIFNHNYCK